MAALALAGCTIEVGPPPESDPPLVPQKAKAPPPPPQPTEPQPWSRDLDLEAGPNNLNKTELAEGLVPSSGDALYSSERLTFESAFNDEAPPSEAELARERARARAAAVGNPAPPQVAAAPVEEVSRQALPPVGGSAEAATSPEKRDWRESRLPPPPKFPPVSAPEAAAETHDAPPEEAVAVPQTPDESEPALATEPPASAPAETAARPAPEGDWRESRLPPPPKFPAVPAETDPLDNAPAAETAEAEASSSSEAPPEPAEVAALPPEAPASGDTSDDAAPAEDAVAAAVFAAEAWDAPPGTILVQVSAVQKEQNVVGEWQRLQARYPQVLKPLRLVVEEAKLGDRGVFYRVQAGAFGSEAGANAACGTLIEAGQACFVVVR